MYLVQECGPTAFVVKEAERDQEGQEGGEEDAAGLERRRRNRGDKKHKVQIGGVVGCTCR